MFTKSFKSAVMVAACLASHYREGPLNVGDISEETGMSVSYIEQLFAKLRRANLVQGVRGPVGGYVLTRPAATISVAELVAAMGADDAEEYGAVSVLVEQQNRFLGGISLHSLSS